MIQVTNSLSGRKESFVPHENGKVKMYVCGPTVYNYIHIGNARPLVFFEVVARYLAYRGYTVTRVMNYTDVDDKIIQKASQEGVSSEAISQRFIEEFNKDCDALGLTHPNYQPKVTEHIPEIIDLIKRLIEKDHAYVASDGEVFFSIRSFPEYGKLSKKKIDDLQSGARVSPDEKKRDPLDFSLWKPRKNMSEPAWESPWGLGRPGWHIECSAMALKYLGESFDIHGGGMDLMHPHHENEIAQSEGATGKHFSKYWIHNNLLTIQSEKMSKSLGNIWLTRDFINNFTAETLKFFLLSAHYRSTIDFSPELIREQQSALHRVYKALEKAHCLIKANPEPGDETSSEAKAVLNFSVSFQKQWTQAMDDDFNTARVFGLVFDYVRLVNTMTDKKGFRLNVESQKLLMVFIEQLESLSKVLNLFGEPPSQYLNLLRDLHLKERNLTREEVESLISKRVEARKQKDFTKSDAIRDKLLELGVEVMDQGTQGSSWDVKFT